MTVERNARTLLGAIGISNFNATMIIRNMFQAPATTDPKSPQIMLLVEAIQKRLNTQGANLRVTRYLDEPTAQVLDQIVGHGWEIRTWSELVANVLSAAKYAPAYAEADAMRMPVSSDRVSLAGMPLGLPDVPGGLVTYGVAAFLLYRHLKKH